MQVFGRYVLNDTPSWAESTALVLVLYVTMFGAAVGVRDAGISGLIPSSPDACRAPQHLVEIMSSTCSSACSAC
jgi:TRAP-type C4-dicarboxylate transport system permease small subunit